MNPPDNEIPCPEEKEIRQRMDMANKYEGGFAPRDTGPLTVMLANHRKLCPFCNGTAAEQLFGQKVRVKA